MRTFIILHIALQFIVQYNTYYGGGGYGTRKFPPILYDFVQRHRDALKALDDVKAHGVNALVVFLGNFGPETPETILCQKFDGPTMYVPPPRATAI